MEFQCHNPRNIFITSVSGQDILPNTRYVIVFVSIILYDLSFIHSNLLQIIGIATFEPKFQNDSARSNLEKKKKNHGQIKIFTSKYVCET
jgi:hypothetical protein